MWWIVEGGSGIHGDRAVLPVACLPECVCACVHHLNDMMES